MIVAALRHYRGSRGTNPKSPRSEGIRRSGADEQAKKQALLLSNLLNCEALILQLLLLLA